MLNAPSSCPSSDQAMKGSRDRLEAFQSRPSEGFDPTELEGKRAQQKLSAGKLSKCLEFHKTIRDPVYVDLKVNRLEVALLDSSAFQRLRRIKQLGTTELVYPGATHTRFDHSLGTLAMAVKMMELIRENPKPIETIEAGSYCELLTRTCALLHDLAHVPFGHTLDDEGNLFRGQWKSKSRRDHYLGDGSEVAEILLDWGVPRLLDDVRDVLFAEEPEPGEDLSPGSKRATDLRFPFIFDIVGNTLCADLLDYLKRDTYFTGLHETYDERFLSYLIIGPDSSSSKRVPRLTLRLYKPTSHTFRRDVLSELQSLLTLRYSVAEKVYFNPSKVASSAMIIEAVSRAVARDSTIAESLLDMGDDELCRELLAPEFPESAFIVGQLRAHRLFKPAYMIAHSTEAAQGEESQSPEKLCQRYRDYSERTKLATKLEQELDLVGGSVAVYCPPLGMGRKLYQCRVQKRDGTAVPLNEFKPEGVQREIERLSSQHEALWKFYVFIARCPEERKAGHTPANCDRCQKLAFLQSDCERMFGPRNHISESAHDLPDVWMRRSTQWIQEHPGDPAISVAELESLSHVKTYGPESILTKTDFDKLVQDSRKRSA